MIWKLDNLVPKPRDENASDCAEYFFSHECTNFNLSRSLGIED